MDYRDLLKYNGDGINFDGDDGPMNRISDSLEHDLLVWADSGFAPPPPYRFKLGLFKRLFNKNPVIIETGTYKGQSTYFFTKLTKNKVITIEPSTELYNCSKANLCSVSDQVIQLNGISEIMLPRALEVIGPGHHVCFFLDGHYSQGKTFSGPNDTPIVQELASIEKVLDGIVDPVIVIDDARCFNGKVLTYGPYPNLDYLVKYAQYNNFNWNIEFDCFCMFDRERFKN